MTVYFNLFYFILFLLLWYSVFTLIEKLLILALGPLWRPQGHLENQNDFAQYYIYVFSINSKYHLNAKNILIITKHHTNYSTSYHNLFHVLHSFTNELPQYKIKCISTVFFPFLVHPRLDIVNLNLVKYSI